MLRINNIRVPLEFNFSELDKFCIKKFRISPQNLINVKLSKKSVDARKKTDVHFIISVDLELKNEKSVKVKDSVHIEKYVYKVNKVS